GPLPPVIAPGGGVPPLVPPAVLPGGGGGPSPTPGVPEPATWAMMLVGVAAIGATMRRRAAVSAV
ncbi:MAG: PEPxxWA-CTERM sorting domain-containing protein, partial [Caulobacteraceae bacterium]